MTQMRSLSKFGIQRSRFESIRTSPSIPLSSNVGTILPMRDTLRVSYNTIRLLIQARSPEIQNTNIGIRLAIIRNSLMWNRRN
jgi:hypothetical protein